MMKVMRLLKFGFVLSACVLLFGAGAPQIGIVDVPASGTAVQMSSTRIQCAVVTVQSAVDNTGNICVGDSTVLCASNPGIELEPGWSYTFPPMDRRQHYDLRDIYADVNTNGDDASWLCFQ
jgi:hypothetical protein